MNKAFFFHYFSFFSLFHKLFFSRSVHRRPVFFLSFSFLIVVTRNKKKGSKWRVFSYFLFFLLFLTPSLGCLMLYRDREVLREAPVFIFFTSFLYFSAIWPQLLRRQASKLINHAVSLLIQVCKPSLPSSYALRVSSGDHRCCQVRYCHLTQHLSHLITN